MKNKKYFAGMNAILAVILAVVIAINLVAVYWDGALRIVLGTVGGDSQTSLESDGNFYNTDYKSDEDLKNAQEQLAHDIAVEGSVLLKNDNAALPLAAGSNVTIFGEAATDWLINGTGSSAIGTESYSHVNVKWSLEKAGFNVNQTVWDYYSNDGVSRGGGSSNGDWSVNDKSWETLTADVGANAFDGYKDAAIVVLGRTGGEGRDLATDMSAFGGTSEESYLELTAEERSLLEGVHNAGFSKVVVVMNMANVFETGFLNQEEYGIDACLLVGPTGAYGLEALGAVLCGEENPSGRLVDTWVYDDFSAPAMQNFGNSRYVDADGNAYGNNYTYVNYAEGIYVGYRYYETRYEDTVMGTANVGEYDYDSLVAYPFGYGSSYTTFEWSNYQMSVADGVVTASVDVTNTGDMAGKDVVEVYYQSPYTDYDKQNKVEKAAVVLGGFAKTAQLNPGEKETVTVTFDVNDMKSYDANGAGSYILDDGTYYITAAQNAHQAVNNVLAAKGFTVDAGVQDMVGSYEQAEFVTLNTDDATGNEVANRFDDVKVTDAEYLTRQNWSMMDNNGLAYSTGTVDIDGTTYPSHVADSALIANIDAAGWEASGRPAEADNNDPVTVDTDKGLQLIDMFGLSFDDPKWDDLLDELKVSEMHLLYNKSGFNTPMVESVNKPATIDTDGPAGLAMFMSGWGSFNYTTDYLLASTWNVELAEKLGQLVGEDGLRSNTVGWYAPAMNTHRTPFGGRCFEYYSEDPIVSGKIGAAECRGATSKGLITYIKHFALNEQETNRSTVCTWSNEQAIREIYLAPFEISIKEGNANGVMDSMNRIGYRYTRGSYSLLTSVLRDEWGYTGTVITDAANVSPELVNDQCLAAGTDLQLTTGQNKLSDTKTNRVRNALRLASKHTLYAVGNSAAMNGITTTTVLGNGGFPVYQILMIVLDAITAIGLILGELSIVKKAKQEAPVLTEDEKKKIRTRRIITLIVVIVVIAVIAIGLYVYIDGKMIATA